MVYTCTILHVTGIIQKLVYLQGMSLYSKQEHIFLGDTLQNHDLPIFV